MTASSLETRIRDMIARAGAITVEDYMRLCLGDPEQGYYPTRDPLGRGGDFITAPEISQIFGELIGLWCADAWDRLGRPVPVQLIELGPGRGTLMADLLRAARALPGFVEAVEVHLVETSPALRETQKKNLEAYPAPLEWHDTVRDVPNGPGIVVANEFFDALPVRQLVRNGGAWFERMVTVAKDGALAFSEGDPVAIEQIPAGAKDGAIFEHAPEREAALGDMVNRLAAHKGMALLIDYGHVETATGDTLQAVREHKYWDPLRAPGEADLTAHVDFAALARIARHAGARTFGPISQGQFLGALGIELRLSQLVRAAPDNRRDDLITGARRLVDMNAMGALFKVMALTSDGVPSPAPFADEAEPADLSAKATRKGSMT